MTKTRMLLPITTLLLLTATTANATDNGLMGALIGAGAGAAIGHSVDRTGGSGKGAIIGAIGGYVIGSQMDQHDNPQQAAPAPHPAMNSDKCRRATQLVDRAMDSRNNDDKIYYLQQATKLCPKHARAHNDLGVAYYTRNGRHDRQRARSEFQDALRIDPNYNLARNNLNSL